MITTRLGPCGGPRPAYGDFSGKTQTAAGGPHPVGHITRLGQHGGPRPRYGDFSGKAQTVVDDRNTGGWIDPQVLAKLRRAALRDAKRPYDAKKRKERERVAELTALYEQITGTAVAEAAADIIRPLAASDRLIPRAAEIDMAAVIRSAEMLAALEALVLDFFDQQEDEELLLLALVH